MTSPTIPVVWPTSMADVVLHPAECRLFDDIRRHGCTDAAFDRAIREILGDRPDPVLHVLYITRWLRCVLLQRR